MDALIETYNNILNLRDFKNLNIMTIFNNTKFEQILNNKSLKFQQFTSDPEITSNTCLLCNFTTSNTINILNKYNIKKWITIVNNTELNIMEQLQNGNGIIEYQNVNYTIMSCGFLSFKKKMIDLINKSNGIIESNMFVVEPGCIIINKTELQENANELFNDFNINNKPSYELSGEFNARLCYLSFSNKSTKNINDTLINLGHLSIYGDIYVTFLIAGISDEVLKEFTAHTEAKINRLTSSKTTAMNDTLYRVFGTHEEMNLQKKYILEFMVLRNSYLKDCNELNQNKEIQNMFNIGMKSTAFTFCMSVKDYHKLFIGRMPENGNEYDIRLMCKKMCIMLHELYPKIIKEPNYYENAHNSDKLYI